MHMEKRKFGWEERHGRSEGNPVTLFGTIYMMYTLSLLLCYCIKQISITIEQGNQKILFMFLWKIFIIQVEYDMFVISSIASHYSSDLKISSGSSSEPQQPPAMIRMQRLVLHDYYFFFSNKHGIRYSRSKSPLRVLKYNFSKGLPMFRQEYQSKQSNCEYYPQYL
jgi:hypothetical protein